MLTRSQKNDVVNVEQHDTAIAPSVDARISARRLEAERQDEAVDHRVPVTWGLLKSIERALKFENHTLTTTANDFEPLWLSNIDVLNDR